MVVIRKFAVTLITCLFSLMVPVMAQTQTLPRWQTLPPTPTLPANALKKGYAPVNGVRIWYAVFGHGAPVLLLHGGLANANYWGLQVPALAKQYQVIVMDTRGHGRSTRDTRPYSYDLMADDVIGLMDFLGLRQAAIVGWSDGGITGLDMAMRYSQRVKQVFAFGANTNTQGLVQDVEKTPTFAAYIARAGEEYRRLSTTPASYAPFVTAITGMWNTQPNFSGTQLATIHVPVWIVDADHEEGIQRRHTEAMAAEIPGAGLLIQPNVSHFSFYKPRNNLPRIFCSFSSTLNKLKNRDERI